MKIFITGATGFIGKNLTERLLEEGHDVICGGRSFYKLGRLKEGVKTSYIDLEKKETLLHALKREKPDVLYHCAALVDRGSLEKFLRVNAEGTRSLLDACLREGVKRIIYLSSVAVVSGNPEVPRTEDLPYKATNAYGRSKIEAEKIALEYRARGLKVAVLRPTMVYGECEPHGLPFIVKALEKRLIPVFGKGEKRLHLVSVHNVVDVMLLCLEKDQAYEGTYFVADEETLTIREFLTHMAEILGVNKPFVFPLWVAKIFNRIPFAGRWFTFYLRDRVYSIDRLKQKLGYVPRISTYEGLRRAVESI